MKQNEIDELRNHYRIQIIKDLEYHRKVPSKKVVDIEGLTSMLPLFEGFTSQVLDSRQSTTSSSFGKLACDHRWSICLLDQTHSHVLHDFFVYRADRFNVIEHYFDNHTLSRKRNINIDRASSAKRMTLLSDTRSLLKMKTHSLFSEQMSTSHTETSQEESKQQTDSTLLVYRPKHFCTPVRVQNLKRNLMMES